MKNNHELTRADLSVDSDMQVDCDIGQEITAYIETWFDVDRKFGVHTAGDDDVWLNMYGKYNPFEDTLRIECVIDRPDGSESFEYVPTERETAVIREMIEEALYHAYGQTPKEFCLDIADGQRMEEFQ